MKLNLIFNIIPQAVQSFRFTRSGHRYQPKKVVDYKNIISKLALLQIPREWAVTKEKIVISQLIYCFPLLKSFNKKIIKRIENGEIVYKDTKPDLGDNLFKGLSDALSGIIWEDDSQIVRIENCSKIYALEPKIIIEIETIL